MILILPNTYFKKMILYLLEQGQVQGVLTFTTKELTDMLRKNRTIDWNRREAERANMRRLVKRLLKQYKYPPEEAEDAMNIVLKQCEQWTENQDVA
ncbi:MAG: DUF3387 domain-containing protein [Prevotella sp.]|nr:DUF3387 domain-containing protein [Prevotella sp.]